MDKAQIKQILLMQIKEQGESGFHIKDRVIYSGMSYGHKFDPDMSDVAILFYQAVYGISQEELLDLNNRNFKGDTMNTSIKYYKTNREEWQKNKYCLANFWILPMDLGRTPVRHLDENGIKMCKHSKIGKIHDYMDVFLGKLNENKELYYKLYEEYFNRLGIRRNFFIQDMADKHFLGKGYIKNGKILMLDKSEFKANEYLPWKERLDIRADLIAEFKQKALSDLFDRELFSSN